MRARVAAAIQQGQSSVSISTRAFGATRDSADDTHQGWSIGARRHGTSGRVRRITVRPVGVEVEVSTV